MSEEICFPGNLFRLADNEHGVLEAGVVAAGPANHRVRKIHADDAPFGHLLGNETREPARAATNIQNVIFGSEAHAVEHGKDNGEMLLLHALPATRFRPAVEFLTKRFGMNSGIRRCLHLLAIAALL